MSEDIKKTAGRPRKVFEVEQLAEVPVEAVVPVAETTLNNVAFGLAQNIQGKWCLCVINFDPTTKQAVVKEVLEETSKLGAAMRFRMMAGPHLV